MSNLFRKEIYVRVCVTVVCAATILIVMPGCPKSTCSGEDRQCLETGPDLNCRWQSYYEGESLG